MDKREDRSRGGRPSSNAPTVTSRRFWHFIRDTLALLAGSGINGRDARNEDGIPTESGVFQFETPEGRRRSFQ